jgi:hypothetical protein
MSSTEAKDELDFDNDATMTMVGALDRILVEAKTLEQAKLWAVEALRSVGIDDSV